MESLKSITPKALQALFTGVLLVASLNAYSQSERGGGNIIQRQEVLSKEEIREYLRNNGIKLKKEFLVPLIENTKLFREDFSSDKAFEEWKFLIEAKTENNTLKDDILFSPYLVSERGEDTPCDPGESAGTKLRSQTLAMGTVEFSPICFNLEKLVNDQATAAQLAALAVHEHSHHFGMSELTAKVLQLDIQGAFLEGKERTQYEIVTIENPVIQGMRVEGKNTLNQRYFNSVCRALTGNMGAIKSYASYEIGYCDVVRPWEEDNGLITYSKKLYSEAFRFNSNYRASSISQLHCLVPRYPLREKMKEIHFKENQLHFEIEGESYGIHRDSNRAQVCKKLTGNDRAELKNYAPFSHGDDSPSPDHYVKVSLNGEVEFTSAGEGETRLYSLFCNVPEEIK